MPVLASYLTRLLLARIDRRHPLLDRLDRPRAGRARDLEAPVITSRAFAGRRYAVLGLARSGLATVGALVASGAGVTAWEEGEDAQDASMAHDVATTQPITSDPFLLLRSSDTQSRH